MQLAFLYAVFLFHIHAVNLRQQYGPSALLRARLSLILALAMDYAGGFSRGLGLTAGDLNWKALCCLGGQSSDSLAALQRLF